MSSASRDFNIVRRKANYVDVLMPKQAGVKGYRIKADTDPAGAFGTTVCTSDIGAGFIDLTLMPYVLGINHPNHVRAVFNPTLHSLTDSNQFWIKFFPVDFAGVEGTGGIANLVLPVDERNGSERIIITATAPNQGSVATSLTLGLPFRAHDFGIKNNSAVDGTVLYVAMAPGGPERQVSGQETWRTLDGFNGCLLVRGGGATCSFSADFTMANPL